MSKQSESKTENSCLGMFRKEVVFKKFKKTKASGEGHF